METRMQDVAGVVSGPQAWPRTSCCSRWEVDPVELLRRYEPVIRFSDLIEHGWTELAQGP